MQGADPITVPQVHDFVVVASIASPGVIAPDGISGFDRTHDWEVKKSQGASGATITDQGEPPAEGSITWQLWRNGLNGEPHDFDDWDAFRALLRTAKTTNKKVTALGILHPRLTDNEIFNVVVKKIGILQNKGGGLYTVTVDFLEYRQPVKAGGTPAGSKTTKWVDPAHPSQPTAQSEAEQEIERLRKEAAAA